MKTPLSYGLISSLLIIGPSFAQRITPGLVGGLGLTYGFQNLNLGGSSVKLLSYPQHLDYLVGPAVDVRLFRSFSLEFDALYRPLNFANSALWADGTEHSISPATVVTWEFPLLLKYRFHARRMRPFVEGGPSFRTAGNLNSTAPSRSGVTLGAGVERSVGWLAVAPALRYTRWDKDRPGPWSGRTRQNQLELVLGLALRR